MITALELAHKLDTIRIGGPTADGRNHLNGSLSNDEWMLLQDILLQQILKDRREQNAKE